MNKGLSDFGRDAFFSVAHIMKKIVLLLILSLSSILMAFSQDYYTGKDYITVGSITYKVSFSHVENIKNITLENVKNFVLDSVIINTKTQTIYSTPYDKIPLVNPKIKEIRKVIDPIINPENKEYDSRLGIYMAVDPRSRTVIEVYFKFRVNENTVTIPPEKFAELEKALISKNFGFMPDDYYIDANYLKGHFLYIF